VCGRGWGKLRIDRLGSADNKNLKVMRATPIHRLGAADVGQNKGIVSIVADIER
jgi:hypothetical protein